jgi:orotidine-5'-phosphate decarboxylase
MLPKDRIIVAVDVDHPEKAIPIVRTLSPYVGSFKFGLELITATIAAILHKDEETAKKNFATIRELYALMVKQLFWDGKFDDIPNTVGAASKVVGQDIGVGIFNVHASAGIEAMMAAAANAGSAKTLALTVLTSREENDAHLDFGKPTKAAVMQFTRHAKLAGLTGVVCSPQELILLNSRPELRNVIKVTPGIRSPGDPADDQRRTLTPREAARYGADYLVIGRPITGFKDPVVPACSITHEIAAGVRERFVLELFNQKNVKFGAFRLKLHEKNPNAPLSPIYLNIRQLPDWMYALAADVLHDLIDRMHVPEFDYVVGIPNAGEPIGMALAKAVGKPHLKIQKFVSAEGRHISSDILDPFEVGKKVLLVDDLITHAETKMEAIRSIEANDLQVVATVVLVDREQGGIETMLETHNRDTYAAMKLSSGVLDLLVQEKKITSEKKEEVLAYVKAN